jgi:hypothetical protein
MERMKSEEQRRRDRHQQYVENAKSGNGFGIEIFKKL